MIGRNKNEQLYMPVFCSYNKTYEPYNSKNTKANLNLIRASIYTALIYPCLYLYISISLHLCISLSVNADLQLPAFYFSLLSPCWIIIAAHYINLCAYLSLSIFVSICVCVSYISVSLIGGKVVHVDMFHSPPHLLRNPAVIIHRACDISTSLDIDTTIPPAPYTPN